MLTLSCLSLKCQPFSLYPYSGNPFLPVFKILTLFLVAPTTSNLPLALPFLPFLPVPVVPTFPACPC
jgi:hypothetical protein